MKRKYFLNGKEKTLNEIIEYLQNELENNGDTNKWAELGIDFEDCEEIILETINYSDIPYNDFNILLNEILDYQCNIVFDERDIKEDEIDYKKVYKIKDVDIQFRKDETCDESYEIAVYVKARDWGNWEFADNITQDCFTKRYLGKGN